MAETRLKIISDKAVVGIIAIAAVTALAWQKVITGTEALGIIAAVVAGYYAINHILTVKGMNGEKPK